MLVLVKVPKHGLAVLSSGSSERTIRGDGDCVEVSVVSDVVSLELAVCKVPHLDVLIPSTRDKDWVLLVRTESDTTNPLRVAIILDGVLALSKGVPQLDSLVS